MREYRFASVGMNAVVQAFVEFHRFMEDIEEPYFLIGGTLLGCVRNGGLLAHDKDIDIGVPDEPTLYRIAEKLEAKKFYDIKIAGVKNGKLAWVRKFIGDNFQVAFELQAHYRHEDSVYYNRPMGPSWEYREAHCVWPQRFFKKYGTVEAYGLKWNTPNPVNEFLETFYGPEWRKEKLYTDWRYNTANVKKGYLGTTKTIMLAGGSRGIGESITKNMIANGYNISVCGRTIEEKNTEKLLAVKCDVTNIDQVKNWVAQTKEKFGYIDVVVYNSGRFLGCRLEDTVLREFDELYSLMMKGYLNVIQTVLPTFQHQRDGYFINIGSTRSVTSAPFKGIYSAAKRGAHALTDTINIEYNAEGITATSANFGIVYTESSIKLYGETLRELRPSPIGCDDVNKTLDYLLSLSKTARPKSLVVGGML